MFAEIRSSEASVEQAALSSVVRFLNSCASKALTKQQHIQSLVGVAVPIQNLDNRLSLSHSVRTLNSVGKNVIKGEIILIRTEFPTGQGIGGEKQFGNGSALGAVRFRARAPIHALASPNLHSFVLPGSVYILISCLPLN